MSASQAWRREILSKYPRGLPKDLEEGFGLLDDGDGAGWDLAAQLVSNSNIFQHVGYSFCCRADADNIKLSL